MRDYADETLNFCLDDGSALLDGPASREGRTQVMARPLSGSHPAAAPTFDFPTQILNPQPAFASPPANSIAVLPFVNIGSDPDVEYFSDGLAEELLNVLSKIQSLRVAARTSSFSFKGRSTTVSEIGQALNVGSVIEGSIRMSGGRMRISVQLVKVENGYQFWSETYDRVMDDIFAVQDDIARSVVGELRSRLLGEGAPDDLNKQVIKEVANATRGRSDNPEAQRLMLLGRYFLDRTTSEDATRAIRHFRDAVELDPISRCAGPSLAGLIRCRPEKHGPRWKKVFASRARRPSRHLRSCLISPKDMLSSDEFVPLTTGTLPVRSSRTRVLWNLLREARW
jgi:TolB-like protein